MPLRMSDWRRLPARWSEHWLVLGVELEDGFEAAALAFQEIAACVRRTGRLLSIKSKLCALARV